MHACPEPKGFRSGPESFFVRAQSVLSEPKGSRSEPKSCSVRSRKFLVRAQRFPDRDQRFPTRSPTVLSPSPNVSPSETKGSRLCAQPPGPSSNVSYPSPKVPSRPAEAAPSKPTDQSGQAQVGHTQAKPDRPAHEPKLEDEPEHGPTRTQTKHPSDEKVLGVTESSYIFYNGPIRGLLAPVWFAIGPKEYV